MALGAGWSTLAMRVFIFQFIAKDSTHATLRRSIHEFIYQFKSLNIVLYHA